MARYVMHVRSPTSPAESFAYMADLSNFAEWDPGVIKAEQVEGDGAGPDAVFDMAVKGVGGPLTLRYQTEAYDPPSSIVARAESRFLTSLDTITVAGDGTGSTVTYDAELTLNGLLGLTDPHSRPGVQKDRRPCSDRAHRSSRWRKGHGTQLMNLRRYVDAVIEAPIVTSFTRLGYASRRRLDHWTPLDDYDLDGQVIALTGATSGLGRAAASQLARCGASLVLVGRNSERNESAVAEMIETTGNQAITQVAADLGDLEQVRALAKAVLSEHGRIDALIHNAGALTNERHDAPDGTEATVASQVSVRSCSRVFSSIAWPIRPHPVCPRCHRAACTPPGSPSPSSKCRPRSTRGPNNMLGRNEPR